MEKLKRQQAKRVKMGKVRRQKGKLKRQKR